MLETTVIVIFEFILFEPLINALQQEIYNREEIFF